MREPRTSLARYMSGEFCSVVFQFAPARDVEALVVCAGLQFCALPAARHVPHVHRVRVQPLVPQAAHKTVRGAVRRAEPQEARRVRLDDTQRLRGGRPRERSQQTAAGGAQSGGLQPKRIEARRRRGRQCEREAAAGGRAIAEVSIAVGSGLWLMWRRRCTGGLEKLELLRFAHVAHEAAVGLLEQRV